jgi:cytochrome c556
MPSSRALPAASWDLEAGRKRRRRYGKTAPSQQEHEVTRLVLTAAAVAAIITTAAAQSPSPADQIRERQAHYKQMGGAMKGIGDQLHSDAPSIDAIRQGSHVILTFAPQLLRWFPRGTGAEAGVRTRALPEIWSDNQNFRRAGAALLVAARTLDAAAQRGDLDAIRAAAPQVAHACGNCHDTYRAPEH